MGDLVPDLVSDELRRRVLVHAHSPVACFFEFVNCLQVDCFRVNKFRVVDDRSPVMATSGRREMAENRMRAVALWEPDIGWDERADGSILVWRGDP